MQAETELIFEPKHYEILSTASIAEVRTHVLKHADTFAVFDTHGDVTPAGNGEQGLYHAGTRYLSRMELWLGHARPVLLSSAVRKDNALLTVNLTNPDITDGERTIGHGMLHFFRTRLVWEGRCYEHLRIRNFGPEPARISFAYLFAADFADIFEVRGNRRPRRGTRLAPVRHEGGVDLGYRGLDGVTRRAVIRFSPEPLQVMDSAARYDVELDPQEEFSVYCCVSCTADGSLDDVTYGDALRARRELAVTLKEDACHVTTADAQFNAWLQQSLEDLNLLLTEVPDGQYPYAGIPWYNTFFGRDGLITALMTLWINPSIARGVLGYLARTQATEHNPERVAEPGKILHEARDGEMAALNEIPFGRYYGTVDATPLFVMVAGEYFRHTNDIAFIEGLWPSIERALAWIDDYGDIDGDGFVEYSAHTEGLTQQGWKDSEDSIFHDDGTLAEGPIALCEVQSYVYAAKKAASRLARARGDFDRTRLLRAESEELRRRFEEAFWIDDISMYALALDG
ncbi:MAG TPA: glycogen debranching N-terminal domain-containing protein, partial [Rhodothermales bacterium]